jgi:leucyl aminopeptidase (aminopeptidase T)
MHEEEAHMQPRMIEIMKYASIPIQLNIKPGESLLIVADTGTEPIVWEALAAAANAHGVETTVALMTPRPANGYEPTPAIAAAMESVDVILDVCSRGLAHSRAWDEAGRRGQRWLIMHMVTSDMLTEGAVLDDYVAMDALGQRIAGAWEQGSVVHITSPHGTDFTARIDGRHGMYIAGKAHHLPGTTLTASAFPDGEATVAPLEESGEGVIVWDTVADMVGLLKEPVRLTIHKGRIERIEGGAEASQLRDILERQNDPNCYAFPAEIAIGLNPKSKITSSMRSSKKLLGTAHLALGTNADIGGTVWAKLHLDGLIRYPTIRVDDTLVVENGKVLI